MANRNYQNSYPSVTQVLGMLRKPGLENWFKWNTAKFCDEESRKGREIGTQIHEAIQSHIEEKEVKVKTQYGEEVMTALKGFMLFKKEHPEIIFKRSEVTLTSEKYQYNGTMDCLAEKDGNLIMADWKTSKNRKEKNIPDMYDEYYYQVAAYVMAYNEQEKADIKQAFVLAIAKNAVAYNFATLDWQKIQDCFNKVFLPALSIWKYQKGGIW